MTRITSRHSQIDYRYDQHGNLLTDSRKVMVEGNTYEHQISYSYTNGNQFASITYPNGQTVHYHYQNGRHSQVVLQEDNSKKETPFITQITHRPFGGMDSWTYGNGLTQRLEHDLDGRIIAVRVQDEKEDPIWQQAYQYDRVNNITGIERSEGQEKYQQQFGYDMLQRLIKDQGPYGQQRFEYDEVGNRLSQLHTQGNTAETTDRLDGSDENLTSYHYAPASNRLLATSEKDIVLDPMGNTLQESNDQQHGYGYNAQNRISEYTKDGQLKARYHYNALGQRIHKAVIKSDGSEQHTLFHYGQQGQLLGETNLDKASISDQAQNIVWLQMRPIVAIDTNRNEAPRIASLHSDHLLTARAATDVNQRLIWRWQSDAFGVGEAESISQPNQPALSLNLRFPGQYHDEESGLYYNYFRSYDPSKGRYTQSDPIGLAGGANTFAYVDGRPVIDIDPTGLVVWTGTYRMAGFAAPGGATMGYFSLESECVSGTKGTADVLFVGPALGIGLEISGSEGDIAFEMHRDDLAPWAFQGTAGVYSASIFGFGTSKIRLGDAWQRPVDGGKEIVIEIGATVSLGSSTLTDFSFTKCGCGT